MRLVLKVPQRPLATPARLPGVATEPPPALTAANRHFRPLQAAVFHGQPSYSICILPAGGSTCLCGTCLCGTGVCRGCLSSVFRRCGLGCGRGV